MTDVVFYIGAGVIFAPALVATLAYLWVHAPDLKNERTETSAKWMERASTWLVYGLIAFAVWTVIALAI